MIKPPQCKNVAMHMLTVQKDEPDGPRFTFFYLCNGHRKLVGDSLGAYGYDALNGIRIRCDYDRYLEYKKETE